MFKNIFESIPGITTYPIISLLLFFGIFIIVVYWAFFKANKSYISKMEKLPLDSSNSSITNGE